MEKQIKINSIMRQLSTTYKSESGPYKTVRRMLEKKATLIELDALAVMIMPFKD